MATWWRGTALVFRRGLTEHLRSRTFKLVTGLLLVLSAATVLIPRLLAPGTTTYTLATVGKAPAAVVATLDRAGEADSFQVKYISRSSVAQVRSAVRQRDATVGLADGTLYATQNAGTFPATVAQALVSQEAARQLAEAGLSPQQVARLQSIRPPRQVDVAAAQNQARGYVGAAVGAVLYLALLFGGNIIATTVATEKSTRISEVLLAVLRPSQVLTGTVLAVGTVTFIELVVLAGPAAIAVRIAHAGVLPQVAAGDMVLGVVWFVLGFALFAFLYAATGALVDKVTEVGTATMPLAAILMSGYLWALLMVTNDWDSPLSVFASLFPLTAPLAMPFRWATGEVPIYQLVVAMALTAATAVAFGALASTVYRRALVITGHRVRLGEVVGRAAHA